MRLDHLADRACETKYVRVLHVIDTLGGGGGAEHALRLQLPELARRGIDSHVVCLRSRGGPLAEWVSNEGTPVTVLDAKSRLDRARQLRSVIKATEPHLVHATLFESCLASRLATPRNVPLLNSLVNTSYVPLRMEASGRAIAAKYRLVRLVDRLTAGRADHFHTLTAAVVEEAQQALGIPPGKITVIPRGRSSTAMGERSKERQDRVRSDLGLSPEDLVVLNVGRQDLQKNQVGLVRSFAEVREQTPNAVLVIAGREGTSTQEINAQVDALGLCDAVRLLGYRTDVADLMAAADVFAFPSLFEGLGSVLVEALALGLPIVASDVPAIREVLDDGRAGRLVAVQDDAALTEALVAILYDGEAREALGTRGNARFRERFELDKVVDATVELYERLAGGPGR
ncbi:glycosyltransferase family 4 protein [Granulicoccus sp. GXG6511]|uniref:glycosyltransferase family 4 protein n=1 Tax=Granulicoccus sp. GXG6511 TaxID=3381351 RepID=UPI003D7F0F3F